MTHNSKRRESSSAKIQSVCFYERRNEHTRAKAWFCSFDHCKNLVGVNGRSFDYSNLDHPAGFW